MKQVLVIDDSIVMQTQLKNSIADVLPDVTIHLAKDGHQAVAIAKEHGDAIDLCFIDYNMPGMNGLETIIALSDFIDKKKMIVLTANVQAAIAEKVKKQGIAGFIEKPVSRDIIASVLEKF